MRWSHGSEVINALKCVPLQVVRWGEPCAGLGPLPRASSVYWLPCKQGLRPSAGMCLWQWARHVLLVLTCHMHALTNDAAFLDP